jgi:hypothetical protein
MIGSEANRKLVQEQWDAFNRGYMVTAAAYFAENTGNHCRPVSRVDIASSTTDIEHSHAQS